ncbi:MAG: acyltransferase [Planctomycetes bacterium]|nr:acyltransferase [Planctomycetota bacterium]
MAAPPIVGTPRPRVAGVDALRALLAISVMVYHLSCWSTERLWPIAPWLEVAGIYAVDGFFVISGFSLWLAYAGRNLAGIDELGRYSWRRFARIFPLYALALAASVAIDAAGGQATPARDILLNLTGAFAACPHKAIPTGGWSIGVELSCYLVLPLVIIGLRSWTAHLLLLAGAIVLAAATTAGFLDPSRPLPFSWKPYTAISNHFALFAAGILLAKVRSSFNVDGRVAWALGSAGLVALLVMSPFAGNQITMSTGWRRPAFCLATVIAIAGVALATLPSGRDKHLRQLGDLSFSLYLLHPICWKLTVMLTGSRGGGSMLVAMGTTLLASAACFRWLERPCMELPPPWRRKGTGSPAGGSSLPMAASGAGAPDPGAQPSGSPQGREQG